MSRRQLPRTTATLLDAATFLPGEIAVDTTNDELRYDGDGSTVGGIVLAKKSAVEALDTRIDTLETGGGAFADVASAGTVDLGAQSSDKLRITGTTTITSFGTAAAGTRKLVRLAATPTITYNATSMILEGDASIVGQADDTFEAVSLGSGNWLVRGYQRGAYPPVTAIAAWNTVLATPTLTSIRERLSASRNYYVRTDGSDSNTGLADSAGGAFLTIQKALDVVAKTLDLNGYNVTINVADGTYTGGVVIAGAWHGANGNFGAPAGATGGNVFLIGNTTTPANCVISTTSKDAILATCGAFVYVAGFKVQTTTSGRGVIAEIGATVLLGEMNFGVCVGSQVEVSENATIQHGANYTISGGATSHWHVGAAGAILVSAITITLTGTPAFSAYFAGLNKGSLYCALATFSGSATGKRFLCHYRAILDMGESNARTFLPGNSAGTTDNGGIVISSEGEIYDPQTTWKDTTPTITAGSGSFTSVAGAASYKIDGTICYYRATITVTTVGTASSTIVLPLPVQAVNPATAHGININSGNAVFGYCGLGGSSVFLFCDTAFPTNGQVIYVDMVYEIAPT